MKEGLAIYISRVWLFKAAGPSFEVEVDVLVALHKGFDISLPCRLTGSSVPDLIVSMSNQMWLHLQSDDSIGSPGFKAVYQGRTRTLLTEFKASVPTEDRDHSVLVRYK